MKKEIYLWRAAQRAGGVWALLLLLASLDYVIAGGPIFVCQSGSPLVWANGGVGISFNPDQGGLGPLDHAQAVAHLQAAFDVWKAVPTSTATYVNAGDLPVDVDITNFADFLVPPAPDGLNAVVFDDTGEIFDLLFGPGSGILGFAGPEWIDPSTCEILEGVSFLNGPAFSDATYALDVMVHEFGHYTGLAHTVVNGQMGLGDNSGPTPDDTTFGLPDFGADIVETMYPFYFGPGIGSNTLEADDVAILSALYPEPGFGAGSGTIRGSIIAPNGFLRLSGVNVIARNIADPFQDAVSAISGDFSVPFDPGDPLAGVYTLRGLTPGAEYAVYVDQILAGGFSTPPITLPGPEEFYNGPDESNNLVTPDNPLAFVPVTSAAGGVTAGIDIIFNGFPPGQPLPLSDDGTIELFLPFSFTICGQTFNTVFVNANGNLTFGFPDGSAFPDRLSFLNGPPRIAGLWLDLNPEAGGFVIYGETPTTFSVIWKKVPEYPAEGANSFTINLHKTGNLVSVTYGKMSATSGIAGLSGGFAITGGLEASIDLSPSAIRKTRLSLWNEPTIFEEFFGGFDLAGLTVRYQHDIDYNDRWAGANDFFAAAKSITLPFSSATVRYFTEIEPTGGDVDFFTFQAEAGQTIRAQTTRGVLDSVLGLFAPDGQLIAADDDSGPGVLSSLSFFATQSGTYTIAVSAFPDFDFTGAGRSGGRYVLEVELLNCGAVSPPGPANWLTNGSFETADLTGWTPIDTGAPLFPWTVSDDSGLGFFRPVEPQDGCFLASNGFDGCGPMQSILSQDVATPGGLPFLTLEWKDRVQWDLLNYGATQDRSYRVEIVDPLTDALIATVHTLTATAGTVVDTAWQSHSADVTPYIGQAIRLRFIQDIPECFAGPGQFELDDVRLRSE